MILIYTCLYTCVLPMQQLLHVFLYVFLLNIFYLYFNSTQCHKKFYSLAISQESAILVNIIWLFAFRLSRWIWFWDFLSSNFLHFSLVMIPLFPGPSFHWSTKSASWKITHGCWFFGSLHFYDYLTNYKILT